MVKAETSGAVKILRQTKSTGTEISPPCEPYSARHNNTFIVTQNAAIKKNVTRGTMRSPQVDGMFKTWPTRIRAGLMSGLASSSALSFTPYLRAMPTAVSPATTVWVRGLAIVAGPAGRLALALTDGTETFCAVWATAGWVVALPGGGALVLAAANWLA